MMRSLKYVSLLPLLLAACSNPYRKLATADRDAPSAMRFRPAVTKELFRCVVDGRVLFKKFHLSGLLLFKTFEDGSTRAVFQNEMGFSFFDFKWDAHDSFGVVSVIPQLDKPALVKTLRKDMNLLLMKQLDTVTERHFRMDQEQYDRFTLEKGYAYYISQGNVLKRIENAGKSKVITIKLAGPPKERAGLAGQVLFQHHKAHFTIDLKKIEPDAN